jgi:hypothetical protein
MKRFNKLALFAGVAELADAQDLGSCGRKAVGVQIPPSAPKFPLLRKHGTLQTHLFLERFPTLPIPMKFPS